MTPLYWEQAKAELSAADPVLAGVIANYPGEVLKGRGDAFYTLARSIVGQQVSVKAADSMWAKFEHYMQSFFGAQRASAESPFVFTQDAVQSLRDSQHEEALRACGLSRQKIRYLGEIAHFFIENEADEPWFAAQTDEEVLKNLTSIVGVGRWTAEMFLIFHLQRPDFLPLDDIGLQRAVEKLYARRLKKDYFEQPRREKYKRIERVAEKWRPWRSVATWYLWRSLDPVPVAY